MKFIKQHDLHDIYSRICVVNFIASKLFNPNPFSSKIHLLLKRGGVLVARAELVADLRLCLPPN